MDKKAFVLFSGGLDSTTALALALQQFNGNVEAVSVDYGQRHFKETEQARTICAFYGIEHRMLNLRGIMSSDNVMLTNPDIEVPNIDYADIKGVSPTYVPFRNGTMLSAITAHAQKYVMAQIAESVALYKAEGAFSDPAFAQQYATEKAKDLVGIYFGAHAEDALNWAYPDCTPEFIGSMANAIYIGSYFTIRLFAPFVSSTKADIVTIGTKLSVPYNFTWSCYKGEDLHCGVCPTCRSRKTAFEAAEVEDPTTYADEQPIDRSDLDLGGGYGSPDGGDGPKADPNEIPF